MERQDVYNLLYNELEPTFKSLGFSPVTPDGARHGDVPMFPRDGGGYFEYQGDKGRVRLVFSDTKVMLLSGDSDAKSEDDSDYQRLSGFLFEPESYEQRDAKSLVNALDEELRDEFAPKQIQRRQQNTRAQATVTRSQVRSGALLYDPATLAVRLAGIFPELKDKYTAHLQYYDEFLCEDFFVNNVNSFVEETIRSRNPQKLKRLFNILNEVFEDGSNEVQDLIVVTVLGSIDYTDEMYNTVLENVSDTMMEPFINVHNLLKKSRSARMRLENPPKYKPKKQKKGGGFLSRLMGGGSGGLQQ